MDIQTLGYYSFAFLSNQIVHFVGYIIFLIFFAPYLWRSVCPIIINFRHRSRKNTLAKSIFEYKKDLSKISQVNEFARYSKLQRKMRVDMDELNNLQKEDAEKNFYYILGGQVFIYVTAGVLFMRILYILIRNVIF